MGNTVKKTYKTVVFDLDGTLLNTIDDLRDAVNVAMKAKGYPLITTAQAKANLGHGVKYLLDHSVPAGTSEKDAAEALALFREYYSAHDRDKTAPYDGIRELLLKMNRLGIGMAIVSNKFDGAVKQLRKVYFDELIAHAVGESEVIAKKPAPDAVFALMKELDANPETTVYVGDSEVDAQTAANAGVDCLLVDWGFRTREQLEKEQAVAILSRPEELLNYL